MIALPSRQVHLDFHTSEHIPGVGSRFSAKQFIQALKAGELNSITVFAKCHHSWSYYPTGVGMPHPALRRNLLGEQIKACHSVGVRAPIYYTVGWSATDAERHPDWVARNADGSMVVTDWGPGLKYDLAAKPTDKRPAVSWKWLCPSGQYLSLILRQTEEICGLFDVDGLFYDICFGKPCYCENCRRAVRDAGGNIDDDLDAQTANVRKWQHLMRQCDAILRRRHPGATLFFNGSAGIYSPQWRQFDTHFEMEDLPTTWGGYDKFPIRARYFAGLGKHYMAMSGKFHTAWGEFGGFKHPDAIRYEAAAMVAYGARCSFGDQMHPCGLMDMPTYRNIGKAYRYVRRIEQYGLDGLPAANLGIWLSGREAAAHDQGVAGMLLESQIDFRVVTEPAQFQGLDAVVLTGDVRLDRASADALNRFADRGGGVLALANSGMDAAGRRFLLDIGARYVGPPRYELDYTLAAGPVARDLPDSPFLNYSPALRVRPTTGRPLAAIREPYFDRTYARYCSHQNTPYRLNDAPHPAIVRRGNVVYMAHALGEMYGKHGARVHRQLFVNALRLVYKRRTLEVAMPSAGRATIIHQPQRRRYVAHLLYGPPLTRGRCQVIDDLVELRDVPVRLSVPQHIRRAMLAPQGKTLPLWRRGRAVGVTVPAFSCHQAVVFEYAR